MLLRLEKLRCNSNNNNNNNNNKSIQDQTSHKGQEQQPPGLQVTSSGSFETTSSTTEDACSLDDVAAVPLAASVSSRCRGVCDDDSPESPPPAVAPASSHATSPKKRQRRALIWSDEVGQTLTTVHLFESPFINNNSSINNNNNPARSSTSYHYYYYSIRLVILLLFPPQRKFEFVQCEVVTDERLKIKDLLAQLPALATNPVLRRQRYTSLCQANGNELVNTLPWQEYHWNEGDMLWAVTQGTVPKTIRDDALELLRHKDLLKAVRKAKLTGRGALHILKSSEQWQTWEQEQQQQQQQKAKQQQQQQQDTPDAEDTTTKASQIITAPAPKTATRVPATTTTDHHTSRKPCDSMNHPEHKHHDENDSSENHHHRRHHHDHDRRENGLKMSFRHPVSAATREPADERPEPMSLGSDTADDSNHWPKQPQPAGHSRKYPSDDDESSSNENKIVYNGDDACDDDDAFESFDPFGAVIQDMNDSFVVPGFSSSSSSSSWSLVNDDVDDHRSSSPDSGASYYTSADAAMDYLLFGESKRILAMKSGDNKHGDGDDDNNNDDDNNEKNDMTSDQLDKDILGSSGETELQSNHFSEPQNVKQAPISFRTTWDKSFTQDSFAIACSAAKERRRNDHGGNNEESQTHDCRQTKDFEKFYSRVPSLDESLDTNDSIDDPPSDDSGCCDDGTLLLKASLTPSSSATVDSSSTTTKPCRRLLNAVMKRQPRDMAKRPVPLQHYSYFVHMAHRVLFPASVLRAASTMGSWRTSFAAPFSFSKSPAQSDTAGTATC